MTGKNLISTELNTDTVVSLLATGDFTNTKFALPVVDSAAMALKIAQRDLNAQSLDELLGGSETISLRDYLNKPFQVTGVEWQQSDIDGDGLPFYAVIHAVSLDGEVITLTTGAITPVRKLAVMAHNGWLPAWVKATKAKKTEAGYEPLDLVKAPQSDIPFGG